MTRLLGIVCLIFSQFATGIVGNTNSTVANQLTLLEQNMTALQTQLQASNREVANVLAKLATTADELVAVKTELRTTESDLHAIQTEVKATKDEVTPLKTRLASAEAELAMLKNNSQQRPSNSDLAAMKSDLGHLMSSSQSPQSSINLTVIDTIGKDVKANVKNIEDLKTSLAGFNQKINETRQNLETNSQKQKIIKAELNAISSTVNNTHDTVKHLENKVQENAMKINMSELHLITYGENNKKTQTNIEALKIVVMDHQTELHQALANISFTTTKLKSSVSVLGNSVSSLIGTVSKMGQDGGAVGVLKTTVSDINVVVGQAVTNLTSLKTEVESKFNALTSKINGLNLSSSGHTGVAVAFQASPSSETFGWSILKFDSVAYNQGSSYDPSTGYFTAPVSGTYLFWTSVLIRGPSANVYINKGSQRLAAGFGVTSPTYNSGTASAIAVTHVKVGENVHFYLDSTADTLHNAMESLIGGVLIRED